jgi:hypothetical protein
MAAIIRRLRAKSKKLCTKKQRVDDISKSEEHFELTFEVGRSDEHPEPRHTYRPLSLLHRAWT